MIESVYHKLMYRLGYRRILYLPSEKGLSMSDFWSWRYRPDIPKLYYTEHTLPSKIKP